MLIEKLRRRRFSLSFVGRKRNVRRKKVQRGREEWEWYFGYIGNI